MCQEGKSIGAFVHNISFPKNYSEVLSRLADNSGLAIEEIVNGGVVDFPVTKWATPGDIVIYMYAKSARKQIAYGLNFLRHHMMMDNSNLMIDVFKEQMAIFKKYGGTIFAIGKVKSFPEVSAKAFKYKNMKKLYSKIEILNFFHNPIKVDDVKEFFKPTKHSKNTPIFGETYEQLKQVIKDKNDVSEYYINSTAVEKIQLKNSKPKDGDHKKFKTL